MKKEIVLIDMDNVLVDFLSGLNRESEEMKAKYADDGTGKPHQGGSCYQQASFPHSSQGYVLQKWG